MTTAGRRARKNYSVEEAAEMLGINVTTLLVLLSAIRPEMKAKPPKQIKSSELERIYGMLKKK